MGALQWEFNDADAPGVANLSVPITRDAAGALMRGATPASPLRAHVIEPGRFADLLSLGFPSLYALSERFAAATAPMTGARLSPIEIDGGPAGYSLLGITGRCGSVDYSRSAVIGRMGKFLELRGLYVQEATAPVEFAVPDNRESILVTSRVAHEIRKMKFSNVRLIKLEEVEFSITAEMIARAGG